MSIVSSGVLLYRINVDLEVFLGHMGGPFWAKKDSGAWSIPKGVVDSGETLEGAAARECLEEVGFKVDIDKLMSLDSIKLKSGKEVFAFAYEVPNDFEINVVSNTFEMEWPKGSGKIQTFPEVDRGEWFSLDVAKTKITQGQVPFLERIKQKVSA